MKNIKKNSDNSFHIGRQWLVYLIISGAALIFVAVCAVFSVIDRAYVLAIICCPLQLLFAQVIINSVWDYCCRIDFHFDSIMVYYKRTLWKEIAIDQVKHIYIEDNYLSMCDRIIVLSKAELSEDELIKLRSIPRSFRFFYRGPYSSPSVLLIFQYTKKRVSVLSKFIAGTVVHHSTRDGSRPQ